MKKFLLKRLLFIPLGIIAGIATLYAQHNPDWTEQVYSQSVYPLLSTAVGFVPSLLGFSLTEWLVVLFILFFLGYVVYYTHKLVIGKDGPLRPASPDVTDQAPLDATKAAPQVGRGMTVYRAVMGVVAIFCLVYFAFTALCGLNYYRHTFSYHSGYSVEQSSTEELGQLCISLASNLGQVREQLGADTDLSTPESGSFDYYAQHSVVAMQALAEQYPVLDRPLYSTPKPVVMSELMSKAGIGGVFFPFTLESNIDTMPPFFTLPSNMAHELAHQCGFMREDEANFIAYLACKQSDEPLMVYSGLYLAFNHSLSSLEKVDPKLAAEILSGLPQAVQTDIAQNEQFWARHEGMITDVSQSINDSYLKANSQTDGIHGYGRMVDLLLAEQRANAS